MVTREAPPATVRAASRLCVVLRGMSLGAVNCLTNRADEDLPLSPLRRRHEAAASTVHSVRAAKPLVCISFRGLAAPPFRSDGIEFPNYTRGVNRMDGDRTQVEQNAVTFCGFAQRLFIPPAVVGRNALLLVSDAPLKYVRFQA